MAWMLATSPDPAVHAGDEAVRHILRAIEIDPTERAYVNTLGVSYYRAGKYSDAIETLERSIEFDGIGKISDHLFLSMAWKNEGEDDIAIETLEGAFDWIDKRKISTLELKETQRFLEDACELMGVELVIVPAEGAEDGK
jgi:tetratricopeptide (TPR) repeat protein